ncbi:MAG: hypothetical protein WDM88_03625 [Galbitalea sp.]
MGIGAVVDPGRVDLRRIEQGHLRGGGQREGGEDPEPNPAQPHEAHEQQRERPDQVELLLDRQRPEVLEELGRRPGEVAAAARDREPVAAEGRGPEHLAADADQHVPADEQRGGAADRHEHDEGGKQPSRASRPEGA